MSLDLMTTPPPLESALSESSSGSSSPNSVSQAFRKPPTPPQSQKQAHRSHDIQVAKSASASSDSRIPSAPASATSSSSGSSAEQDASPLPPRSPLAAKEFEALKKVLARETTNPKDFYHRLTSYDVVDAINEHYSSPMPEVDEVFPWMHGTHPKNLSQRAFLDPQKRYRDASGIGYRADCVADSQNIQQLQDDPRFEAADCIRGLMLVKADPEVPGVIVGSVDPAEILDTNSPLYEFRNLDPESGISLRNFDIQVAKWAHVSDIIVYTAKGYSPDSTLTPGHRVAALVSKAQEIAWSNSKGKRNNSPCPYKTYLCTDGIDQFLEMGSHVVAEPPITEEADSDVMKLKNWDSNFLFHERVEMSMMSAATPVSDNVWLGNTADYDAYLELVGTDEKPLPNNTSMNASDLDKFQEYNWATFVECYDGAQLPELDALDSHIRQCTKASAKSDNIYSLSIHCPSSGSLSQAQLDLANYLSLASLCKLIYVRSHSKFRERVAGTLFFCSDGYTETSLIALAYIMYASGVTAAQAYVDLHVTYNRPFFCFQSDPGILQAVEKIMLEFSPAVPNSRFNESDGAIVLNPPSPTSSSALTMAQYEPWFSRMDGSLPSRVMPHFYLGSLVHAENVEMLTRIGIRRVLSVGETLSWVKYSGDAEKKPYEIIQAPYPGIHEVMYMNNIQDDGVDPLAYSLKTCLDFLDRSYNDNQPTLIHCRVGVSRSASVSIAEVMKRLGVGLPRAYLFVRVRRLNVIIQPNLRFMYELLKWEEMHRQAKAGWLREVDWHILCREVARINKAYIAS